MRYSPAPISPSIPSATPGGPPQTRPRKQPDTFGHWHLPRPAVIKRSGSIWLPGLFKQTRSIEVMRSVLAGVLAVVVAGASLTAQAGAVSPEDQIKLRKAGYSYMSWNMG